MLEETLASLIPIVSVALSAGVAYGILKVKTSITQERLDELEKEALAMDSAMQGRVLAIADELHRYKQDTTDRLARIETKLDILLSQK